ncbi:MAG: hypothetical protein A2Y62_20855 [Candidatus Fischerbacteria bacterium RBG_13_37_8]|uniref:Uncharacterized protein n=1 Tax=Candidatus Fischerbacteria bacterium RBG_13_37_8 TaxID=1817863 RepID=A0A1F5VEV1_9BACT|nr:MAG: hypothetical protein A2Y62_20855 [Candidatus Fischerbacteria bacterium RBG_13_37_8]
MNRCLLAFLLLCMLLFAAVVNADEVTTKHSFPDTDARMIVLNDMIHVTLMEKPLRLSVQRKTIHLAVNEEIQTFMLSTTKSSQQRVKLFQAWRLSDDEKQKEIGREHRYERPYSPDSLYSDIQEVGYRIPDVKTGERVIFEYTTEKEMSHRQHMIVFSREFPIEMINILVTIPSGWEVKYIIKNFEQVPMVKVESNTYQIIFQNVDKIPDEGFAPPESMTDIEIGLMFEYPGHHSITSWKYLSEDIGGVYQRKAEPCPSIERKVKALFTGTETPLEKIRKLSEYVQKEIRYVAIEIGKGSYIPHKADSTLSVMFGDCKDKATLLTAMLQNIGVKAHSVLCSPRELSWIDEKFPSVFQFAHAIVAIELPGSDNDFEALMPGSNLLFFDPTDRFTPFGSLSYHLQGVKGLVLGSPDYVLVSLPDNSFQKNTHSIIGQFVLDDIGNLSGSAKHYYYGAERYLKLAHNNYRNKQEMLNDLLNELDEFISPELSDFKITPPKQNNEPFIIDYKIKSGGYAQDLRSILVFNPVLFMRISRNPFVKEKRTLPVVFPYAFSESARHIIQLPQGFALQKNPVVHEFTNPHADYKLEIIQEGNLLRIKRLFSLKDNIIPLDEAKDFISFYHQILKIETTYTQAVKQ